MLFYLIYPAIVAVISAILSYFGALKAKETELKKVRQNLTTDFLRRFLLDLENINNLLLRLADDPNQFNYFSLQNIDLIKSIVDRAQSRITDSLYLLTDPDLVNKILSVFDLVSSTVSEIEAKEKNPVQTWIDHNNTVKEALIEYKALKLKLLEMDIYLDANDNPHYISNANQQQELIDVKLKQVSNFISVLNSTISKSQAKLNEINEQTKDQRAFLAVKLLTAQTKVDDLSMEIKGLI